MAEPAPAPGQRNGSEARVQNGNSRIPTENSETGTGPSPSPNHNHSNQQRQGANGVIPENVNGQIPLEVRNPVPQLILAPRRITAPLILKYIVSAITVIGFFTLCLHVQREYYIRQLLKYSPSPSPFTVDDSLKSKSKSTDVVEEEPESDVISIKYQPPSEVLQKIPFLRKTEEEIYADQMKQVMWSLREAVKRMDHGGNETQLAGVITMKPNDTPENVVNVKADDFEEGIFEDEDDYYDNPNPIKDLEKRISSALSETSKQKDLSRSESKPAPELLKQSEEDPIAAILNYRKQYFHRDRELAQIFSQSGTKRDPKLIDEHDQRDAIRRRLIASLIDNFFATETDDEVRIEKAYHYGMSTEQQYERIIRLETEIFGPEDLVRGGPDEIFGNYRQEMGYVYAESLKTFVNGNEMAKLKKLEARERVGFFVEMRILLKLEKRIKAKVVSAAKAQQARAEL